MPSPGNAPGLPERRPAHLARSGFFRPGEPARPWAGEVDLHRLLRDGDPAHEVFRLGRPIGYWDRRVGPVVVPADLASFVTDLTSVPRLLTWLVPTTGQHLPAALVHDALVAGGDGPASYLARVPVSRVAADRIFRDALRDLGVPRLRRWLMWSGVSAATMVTGPLARTWRGWLAVLVTGAAVAVGGALATADLLDRRALLPWMGERPWQVELLTGALAAVVVPLLLSPLWGRRWRAGALAGAVGALLLHVSTAVALVLALYSAAESLLEGRWLPALGWSALAAATAGAVAAAVALLG